MNKKIHPWLDIRNRNFFRVAAVSMATTSDVLKNAKEIIRQSEIAYEKGAQLVVFPELSLTSYTLADLHRQTVTLENVVHGIEEVVRETAKLDSLIVFGSTIQVQGALYNCAVVCHEGQILGIIPKSYLPDYGEFREHRWWNPAENLRVDTVSIGEHENVPIGTDLLFYSAFIDGLIVGGEICEDLWVPNPPSISAALHGATVLFNLSASPEQLSKLAYRHDLVAMQSARCNAAYIYAGVGYGESTSDLAWSGDSSIADRGAILISSESFLPKSQIIMADIDLLALTQDRMRTSSFAQNAQHDDKVFRMIEISGPNGHDKITPTYQQILRDYDPSPLVPKTDEDHQQILSMQVTSLMRRMEVFPEDQRKIVIGLSGGKDSTWALMVAYIMILRYGDRLCMRFTDIIGITMPGFGTTDGTKDAAIRLAEFLEIDFRTIPISDLTSNLLDAVDFPGLSEESPWTHQMAYENSQAWMRKYVELVVATLANDRVGAIVLGSGTMSELLLGWTTFGGDQLSHYAINVGLAKSAIPAMILWYTDQDDTHGLLADILYEILDIAASPELAPLDDGVQNQNTELLNGPYEVHDFYAYYFLRFGFSPQRIARMAYQVFYEKYAWSDLLNWLEIFIKRVFSQQYKRNSLSVEGPKIGAVALSSRDEWRMPGDASSAMWLADFEKIPKDFS